jgi:uncharacterized protein YjiS (DUF1127 family)
MLFTIIRFVQNWKRYNARLNELSHLDDRQLAARGLTRQDIPRLAVESAQV